jgi:CRP-like cAMP-binding protein
MTTDTETIRRTVRAHPFFAAIDDGHMEVICRCARHTVFKAGDFIYREGQPADTFHLIVQGRVALEVHVPGRTSIIVETLKEGDPLGWSWLLPPYRTSFDARALELVRVVSLDAHCLRASMEEDHTFGYELYKRFAPVIASRLASARRQMIDMYGKPGS